MKEAKSNIILVKSIVAKPKEEKDERKV